MTFTKRLTKITLGLGALAVVGTGVWAISGNGNASHYQPREADLVNASSHGAFEYIKSMRANLLTGEVSPADEIAAREMALQQMRMGKTGLGLEWEEAGPDNFGGRTRAFLIDKDNPNLLFAGSVAGGLFRSTNGGASWLVVNDNQENLAVVSICQATNGDIYYGTGEGMYAGAGGTGSSGTLGGGVFKSTDRGLTFTRLQSTVPIPNNAGAQWASVGQMIAHKTNPNIIWAATNSGLLRTTDGGSTWAVQAGNLLPNSNPVTDMTQGPDGSMWVAFSLGRVIYSPDGEDNWTEISKIGAGPTDIARSPGRQAIAVSPQDANFVYVVQSISVSGSGEVMHGVWRSTDKGTTWARIATKAPGFDPFVALHGITPSRGQAFYDMDIIVPANNKDRVLVAGVDMWDWELNKGWRKLTQWNAFRLSPFYVHADHHRFRWDATKPNTVYLTTDGGVSRSNDGGISWGELNRNYATIQFYAFDVNESRHIMGGTQDNGTFLINGQGNTPNAAFDIFGGDGGWTAMSRLDPKVWYLETQYGNVRRTENGGESYGNPFSNRVAQANPAPGSPGFAAFVAPFVMHESVNDTKSVDSVTFIASSGIASIGFGNGIDRTFAGLMNKPQASANFIVDSFKVVSGALVLNSDAQGNLTGSGTGTFNPATGEFQVTFNSIPFAEIIATCDVFYNQGAELSVRSRINQLPFKYALPSALSSNDTLKIQDPVQSVFFFGPTARSGGVNGFGGVFMTRDAHNFSRTPIWWRLASLNVGETPRTMSVSRDGDVLWVAASSNTGAGVYRISGINNARSAQTGDIDENHPSLEIQASRVASYNGRTVTSIAIDPNDNNKVVITLGNYGNTNHVFYSTNAMAPQPNFINKTGTGMPAMPIYGGVINQHNSNEVILATEFGIYTTSNINAPNVTWTRDNNGMPNVPSFFIKQFVNDRPSSIRERLDANGNTVFDTIWAESGDIYVGTHGRGMFKTGSTMTRNTISTNDVLPTAQANSGKDLQLNMYPNPAIDFTNVDFDVNNKSDVTVSVRDLNGRLVKMLKMPNMAKGSHKIKIETDDLKTGFYFITVSGGGNNQTGKLFVSK